jgi:4-amino-4-deoxy-L-arabinose transferase-like glycosyltransferase
MVARLSAVPVVFMAVILPALTIVVIAAGGPHEASGESWVWVATFLLATLMWYGLMESARVWRQHRTKRDHSSH